MVRSDEQFLRKWVEYYGAALGTDNLYIFFDGEDQQIPEFCSECHVTVVPHVEGNVHEGDRGRIAILNDKAAQLLKSHDAVIGTDVDEFLIPDPAAGCSLVEFISRTKTRHKGISALGIDVGQNLDTEGKLDWNRPILNQRSFAKLSTRYSKASVMVRPSRWGCGFHRIRKSNFHIEDGLYLFHFGCADLDRLKSRMQDSTLLSAGWSRHLKKRARTIFLCTRRKAHDWGKTTPVARFVQNAVRPPYALNKPAMFELEIIVRIPERFKGAI